MAQQKRHMSDSLNIGYDESNKDEPALIVTRRSGKRNYKVVCAFYGDTARKMYDELSGVLLINTKKEKEKMLNPYESYVSQYAKNHGISVVEAENRPMCKARLEYFNKTGK